MAARHPAGRRPAPPGRRRPAGGVPGPGRGQPSRRQSAAAVTSARPRVIALGPLRPALDALAAHDGDAVVLASGDPGFFGIVRALRERGLDCVVLPATSSVALAFARAGLPWDDAVVVSAHGRELRAAVNVCRAHPKVAVLTGPGQGRPRSARPWPAGRAGWWWPRTWAARASGSPRAPPPTLPSATGRTRNVVLSLAARAQLPRRPHKPLTPEPRSARGPANPAGTLAPQPPEGPRPADQSVIKRLVSPERHQSHDHEGAATPVTSRPRESHRPQRAWASRCWPLAWRAGRRRRGPGRRRPRGRGPAEGWALGEEAFEHRDSMVTKPEVRALALARLGPRPGVLVWDVGAGSGSVAVECARFGAAVIAVDRDPAQCARVAANSRRHRAEVRVVGGAAPEALDGLPDPDAVFVGGGGLPVVRAVAARRPARIVVALAAVERAGPAMAALAGAGYRVEGTLLQVSHLSPLPDGTHRLAPRTRFSSSGRPDHTRGQGRTDRAGGGVIGLIAVTAAGRAAADRLARAWPGETRHYPGPAGTALPRAWAECEALVCFLAAGAIIRLIAPLLASKHTDPAVVCVDEASRHAIALLGGHGAGANDLAARAAAVLGADPVLSTATDAAGLAGLDTLGWPAEGAVAAVSRAMLDGEPVWLDSDATWPLPAFPPNVRLAPGRRS